MAEIKVPSGSKVVINAAPWKDAKELKKAIERELAAKGASLEFNEASLAVAFLAVDGSDAVERALAPCLLRCTYNDEKITESTFDPPEARKDYYDIVIACMKENLSPLADSLFSELEKMGVLRKQAAVNPESTSPTIASS